MSTGKLVEYLSSPLVDLQDMERWNVEELSRMLDPTGDNRCVDQQLFIWIERVLLKEEKEKTRIEDKNFETPSWQVERGASCPDGDFCGG